MNQTQSDQSVIEQAREAADAAYLKVNAIDAIPAAADAAMSTLLDHLIDGYAKSAYEPGSAPGFTDLCELRRRLEPVE